MILNSNSDMLLYIGMADAYAKAAEYLNHSRHADHLDEVLKFDRYLEHPKHKQPSLYTDDSEMSSAVAHVLIDYDAPFKPGQFAEAWFNEFQYGGRRKGYSHAFQDILESSDSVEDMLSKIVPTSEKNGACMRAVPIGVLSTPELVVETAVTQACVTHDTPPAIFSAKVIALLSHFALHKTNDFSQAGEFCMEYLEASEKDELYRIMTNLWNGRIIGNDQYPVSITTAHAVHHILTTEKSLMDMLRKVIHLGGDTDTVAAICWGIASSRYKYEALPFFMENDLENGSIKTGASYLRGLGRQLMMKYV